MCALPGREDSVCLRLQCSQEGLTDCCTSSRLSCPGGSVNQDFLILNGEVPASFDTSVSVDLALVLIQRVQKNSVA